MTDKTKYRIGDKYRLSPPPKQRSPESVVDDNVEVTGVEKDLLHLKHLASGAVGSLHFDSVNDYRKPIYLMIVGQVWITDGRIEFEPGFDPRMLAAMAKKAGLGLYLLEQHAPQDAAAALEEQRILQIISGERTDEAVFELQKILPVAKSKLNELQILLALIAWMKETLNPTTSLEYVERGIALTKELKLPREEGVFHSQRAVFLSQIWMNEDLNGWYRVQVTNRIGYPAITEDEQKAIVVRLNALDAEIKSELQLVANAVTETSSFELAGLHYSNSLIVYGLRATHLRGVGVAAWVNYKAAARRILADGKTALQKIGDKKLLGYLYHNAANQLRFLDETAESLGLAEEAQRLGAEVKDLELERMAGLLIERIKNPKTGSGTDNRTDA